MYCPYPNAVCFAVWFGYCTTAQVAKDGDLMGLSAAVKERDMTLAAQRPPPSKQEQQRPKGGGRLGDKAASGQQGGQQQEAAASEESATEIAQPVAR